MSLDVKRQLSCLTECSVCKETYNDPRMLPCVHSFCVICIQGFCDNKLPGDHVPCPICRKIFTVPDNGVDGLPKNFFIEQLKDVTLTSNRHCEGCYDGGTDPALQKQAAFYCVECQQKLCETCVNVHKRLRTTREHRLAEIGQDENIRFAHRDLKIIYCRKHPARAVEMYCLNCKDAICLMCFVELHKSHECSDVNKFVDEFKIQMTNDIKNMEQTVKKVLDVVKEQQERKENFSKHVDEIELKICKRAEQLKKAIDSEKQKLIQELASRKKDRIKQMQLVIVEVERRVSFVESLIKYTEELRDKGSASDVAQQARNLHDRADELVNLDDVHRQINDLGSMQFLFNAVKLSTEATGCLIGHVDWQHFKDPVQSSAGSDKTEQPPIAACCELYSKEDVTVVVVGDLLNFYRCVAVHCSSDLQLVKRNPSGTPRDPSTWTQEDKLTEEIKTRVSSLLKSSSAQVQFAEDTFNDRVEDQNLSSETLPSRLRKILMRNRGHTDPLEFLAVAFLAKTQIHIFEEFANGYKLLTKYAHHAYSSRHPLTLLVKPRASGSEHFDVLVVNRSRRQHLTTDGINPFDVLAQSAAEEDRKITFELLLSHGGKTLKQLTDSGIQKTDAGEYVVVNLMASQADDNRCDNGGNKSAPSQTDTGDASIIDAKSDVEKSEKKEPSDNCVICMDTISSSKRLDCGHVFCVDCIDDYFKKCQPKCPSCGKVFGALRGNQPPGTFRTNSSSVRLSGYEQFRSIEIHYNFPNGIQTADHPNPGQPYKGTYRVAYLPDCLEGREVCQLLKRAFDAGLVFTVDRSVTTGADNCVVWNNAIHHKTKPIGPFGYPDPTYLTRVKDELAAMGIVL